MQKYFNLSVEETLKALNTSKKGLSKNDYNLQLKKYGYNEVTEAQGTPKWLIFLQQFNNPLVYILLVIGFFSIFLGKYIDSTVIFGVLLINAILGFIQEYRAEKSVQALKKLVVQTTKVIREGQTILVSAREIVPGDIICIEEGDKIIADGRIIHLKNFSVVESALTGEAFSIVKKLSELDENTALADRFNMVFSGSYCATGSAKVVVTETGNNTEMGKIAQDLNSIKIEESHFHKKVAQLGKQISIIALIGAGLNFVLGQILGTAFRENLFFAIGSLVSGIPEGLPAILALILSVGANKMANKNAIVRVLTATETAGAITVIASDKTGTLTENTMTVQNINLSSGDNFKVSGEGWSCTGDISTYNESGSQKVVNQGLKLSDNLHLQKVLEICAISQQAVVDESDGKYTVIGDPTEAGLFVLAKKAGLDKIKLSKNYEILDDLPFNSDLKMRATLVTNKETNLREIFVVGAAEEVLNKSILYKNKHEIVTLTSDLIKKIEAKIDLDSQQGWRVLGLALKNEQSVSELQASDLSELTFLGYVVLVDPVRPEVTEAVKKASKAGIRTIMITGDHKNTALSIAKQIGIVDEQNLEFPQAVSEAELNQMSDQEVEKVVLNTNVFARCTPNRKLKILEILQKNGEIVAMTGDGVNDAPALKKSNVSFAMGKNGTDVARESAQIVLSDDNFATIVKAVEEGRVIYNNVTRASNLALNRTLAGIGTLMGAIIVGSTLPFSSTQLLWLNLVTETIMGVGMAFEKAHGYEMHEQPTDLKKGILSSQTVPLVVINSLLMIFLTLVVYKFYLLNDAVKATTSAFLMLYFTQFFNLLALRSFKESIFSIGVFTNPAVNIGLMVSVILQIFSISLPFLASTLGFVLITPIEIILILIIASSVLWLTEISKIVLKKIQTPNKLEV